MENMRVIYFTTRIGPEKKQIPFETPNTLIFLDIVAEIAKKLGLNFESISISTPGGNTLTDSNFNETVDGVIKKFGTSFEIIDRGVVGNDQRMARDDSG